MGCLHMLKKVSTALDAHQQSPNYDTAKTQARGARDFCAEGLYKVGIDQYNKALATLDAS